MIPKEILLAAVIALAPPALGGPKVELKVRTPGGEWKAASSVSGKLQAGAAGSGVLLDGISIEIRGVKAELLPFIERANRPKAWTAPGQPAGQPGKKLEGFCLKVDKGTVRYRGSFAGVGLSEWAEDGAPVGGPQFGIYLEAVEVDYRPVAPVDAPLEFRAAFRGAFTPWLKAGSIAAGTGEKPALTALEVRSGFGIRYEVCYRMSGWQTTATEGEVAGDPGSPDEVESIRIFSGPVRLGYRVKPAGRDWTQWCYRGDGCGQSGSGIRIEAVQIAKEAAPAK